MATAKRNIKEVIATEGQKLNNTSTESKDAESQDDNPKSSDASDDGDLAATVAELKAALEAATKREDTLQKQITSLQSEMNDQKVHVEKLEKLELKAELDEAKQTALKLAERNSELEAEIKALKGGGQLARKSDSKTDSKSAKKTDSKSAKSGENVTHTIYERPIGKSQEYVTHTIYDRPVEKSHLDEPKPKLNMWLD